MHLIIINDLCSIALSVSILLVTIIKVTYNKTGKHKIQFQQLQSDIKLDNSFSHGSPSLISEYFNKKKYSAQCSKPEFTHLIKHM